MKKKIVARPRLRELFLFSVAGVVNAATYLSISLTVLAISSNHVLTATTLGYIGAVAVNFFINATFTFERGRITSAAQASKHLLLYVIGYLYNLLVVAVGTQLFDLRFLTAVIIITFTWPVFSFMAAKHLVFR